MELTIIIPHYNSTISLNRLIGTIPDSRDIQIIVIDDHSDVIHQGELKRIQRRYPQIEVHHNTPDKNGAGACRNIGLDHARGKWILFADADDYFMEGFDDIIYKYFQSEADIIFFKPTSIEEVTGDVSDRHVPLTELIDGVADQRDSERAECSLKYKFIVPWSKLIRRAFIKEHQLAFDEVVSANDVMFSTKVGYHLNTFDISEDVIYCATTTKGSLTMTVNDSVFATRLNVFINQYHYLQNRLSDNDFKKLGLSGRPLLIKAANLGFKKVIAVFYQLKKHKVRVVEPKLLNPIWFAEKALFVYKRHKRERAYVRKG